MRLWVIAVVLLVPAAGAAPVDLYMHLAGFQDMPINTQEPQGESLQHRGLVSHSGCVPSGINGMTTQSLHTWYGFSSPGLVEYGISEEGPRIHQERGLGTDLRIKPELPPVLTWNLMVAGPADGAEALAAVVPEVLVRVHVRANDDISVGHEAFDAAPLVAFGEVGPVTLHERMDHPSIVRHEVSDGVVYTFEVPLALHNTTILQNDGYNIRIDVMMDNPHCMQSSQGGYIMPDLVTAYQGHGLWNKLHISIENPLSLESMHLQPIRGDLVVHVRASSPFGMYDVAGGHGLVVSGPSDLPIQFVVPVTRYHDHGHVIERAYETAWVVNVTSAPQGLYTVALPLTNGQNTANLTATATFEIGDRALRICQDKGVGRQCVIHRTADSLEVPALPLAWLLGAVVLGRRGLQAVR